MCATIYDYENDRESRCTPTDKVEALLPGTIENDFRRKSALGGTGGKDELDEGIKHNWEGLLLQPERGAYQKPLPYAGRADARAQWSMQS